MNKYAKQDRGNLSAYEEYFAGMDASMQQKIALTTAHFPSRGKIADMGSGSGSGTFDLARLYHDLELIGVDINPVTVEYSKNHYKLENLSFEVGDIAENVFPADSLDGILDSSVLHHVTSFNNFDINNIFKTLSNQVAQLKESGVLIIRDFVIPDEADKLVYLDLPTDDGTETGEIAELSTAALFEIFARDFRSCVNMNEPVEYKTHRSLRENFARFEVTLKTAAEFVLRKDYRDHWSPELLEEYTYFSQADFESAFKIRDLRIVVSMPLWNPWIVANRFTDKFHITDSQNNNVHFPPTNYLIVGEKVAKNAGVQLSEQESELTDLSSQNSATFLKLKGYRHKETNQIYELAMRPHQTLDILPWFEDKNGQLFVIAKKDFPRPIVNAQKSQKNLNRANYSGYLTEPISAIADLELGMVDFQKPIEETLAKRANLDKNEILEISEPNFYFTSAGGIDERVESFLVQIKSWEHEPLEIENYTPFTSAGYVREMDALQVLRASHVGGMFDARLEINIYRLLRFLNRSSSAWIGAEIKPIQQSLEIQIETIFEIKSQQVFEPYELAENTFLSLKKANFIEADSDNKILAEHNFEYIVPHKFSKNTVAAIPFFKTEDDVFVGIEFRDLPAPQSFTGNSQLACVPAWRLPLTLQHKFDVESFLHEKFPMDFNISLNKTWELGGSYFTSAGITPEIVYPMAVEINAESLTETDLKFFSLKNLLSQTDKIQDAHLLILLNRLGHALGIYSI